MGMSGKSADAQDVHGMLGGAAGGCLHVTTSMVSSWFHRGVIGSREKLWRADALGPTPLIAVAISRLRLATV
jgi:hypothetical protein